MKWPIMWGLHKKEELSLTFLAGILMLWLFVNCGVAVQHESTRQRYLTCPGITARQARILPVDV